MISLRNLLGRWQWRSPRHPTATSNYHHSSSRTEGEGGDAPNKRPKLDCQDIADKVRCLAHSRSILIIIKYMYSPLWISLGDLSLSHPQVPQKPRCEEM